MKSVLVSHLFLVILIIFHEHYTVYSVNYTKDELIYLADELLEKFDALPKKLFDELCANTEPDSAKNPYYKFVLNIQKELADINWEDDDGTMIKIGYTLLKSWTNFNGSQCHPSFICKPPADLDIRLNNGWMAEFKCGCASTKISDIDGISGNNQEFTTSLDQGTTTCRYNDENSYCHYTQDRLVCKDHSKMCLIYDVNVSCTYENFIALEKHLKTRNVIPRSDSCKCRPISERASNEKDVWYMDGNAVSAERYILKGKRDREHGEDCANVSLLIEDLYQKYILGERRYVFPPEALQSFMDLHLDPLVAPCNSTKELFCEIPSGGRKGVCKCNPLPTKSGYKKHPVNVTTPDGFCALEVQSDCETGIQNNFTCYPPNKCLIEVLDENCTLINLRASHHKYKDKRFLDPKDERFMKRCHCSTGTLFAEEDGGILLKGTKKKKPKKGVRKIPIFDLGYGLNCSGWKSLGYWLLRVTVTFYYIVC